MLVLDTRPRGMSEQEKESLHTAAAAALEALELCAVSGLSIPLGEQPTGNDTLVRSSTPEV